MTLKISSSIHLFFILLAVIITSNLSAQQSAKTSSLDRLVMLSRKMGNTDSDSLQHQLETVLNSMTDDEPERGKALYALGELSIQQGMYDSAYNYFYAAVPGLEKLKADTLLGHTYIGLGYALTPMLRLTEALDYNLKAEKIFRELNDKAMLSRVLNRMGYIFFFQADYESATKYTEESLQMAEEAGDTLNVIRALNSLSESYDVVGNFEKSEATLLRAIALGQAIGCLRCLAVSYSQLGIAYHFKGRYHDAIAQYGKEYEANKLLGLEFEQFFVFQNISEAYLALGEYDRALVYSDSAKVIMEDESTTKYLSDLYRNRYDIFKAKGQPAAALEALEKQMEYDKIQFDAEKARIQEDMKTAYETERREAQIADLERENTISRLEAAQARQWWIYLAILAVMLLISALVLYSRYQLKLKSERALDAKNKELQDLNAYKDRLFAIISHDLKSPLSSFSSITSTLNEYFDQISPEEIRKYMARLSDSARTIEGQMKNLLEWALSQMAERSVRPEWVEVSSVFSELKSFFQLNLEIKKQQLYLQLDNLPELYTDREYLHTIFRNLISNAIKFTPAGGSIWISAQFDGSSFSISVKDSGIGIAAADFEKLFSLSADKKSIGSSPEKGTGLGLVLVKEMVDKLGGTIKLFSTPGEGSHFQINLQAAQIKTVA